MLPFESATAPHKADQMRYFLATTAPVGVIVEIGVWKGGFLAWIANLFPDRKIYGYDTFAGMPKESNLDNFHKEGDFMTTLQAVQCNLLPYPNITLIQGIYPQSDIIKPSPIALAHVDVDLYQSTYQAFCHLKPFMAHGGRIYCDDAFAPTCQGATIAMEQFAKEQSMPLLLDGSDHGYFQF